ncbi:hypothetical protein A4D02_11350 [Niastella koreensis]|uniref:Uncharacterized protein n=2 Tax=Niastella koreensis TaxID=354356 RepID=G8T9G4_NIAKG|nr:hypothetical protein [Niastella koreensis]AEV99154.1 hypothetical protein Niako_2820 [Niastella koreensis GR20-10]OQP44056.1 hypothetical protein A4D02_11350 [Niastella koreensis]
MTLVETISGINQELRTQLEKFQCERGELRYQAPSMVSLSGIDAYDKPVLIWQTGSRLGYLLSQYVDKQADCGGVIIAIRLPDQFFYTPVAKAAIQQQAKQRATEQQNEASQAKLNLRQELAQKRTPFGWELAEKVANAVQRNNSIGYGHRDYCGMGFEYRQGIFFYGELWDGAMPEATYEWSSKEGFVAWLAHQSDASLGRLEAQDSFYWGNQTITRERLISLG